MVTAIADLRCMFIEGNWCEADDGRTLGVINPATDEVLSDVAYGGRAAFLSTRTSKRSSQTLPWHSRET